MSISDANEFEIFLKGPVYQRVTDSTFTEGFEQDLLGLATTDMGRDIVRDILAASPPPVDWEVGEAMAECLLECEFSVRWPWNENRDRKTPRASLPGADIVGFIGEGEETRFLFGEVKTSSDLNRPPGVMSGRSGLAHQLETLRSNLSVHSNLLKYLMARCKGTPFESRYQTAVKRFVTSGGKDIELVGILLRDTQPHEDDLRTRGQSLAGHSTPPRVRLDAWYMPRPISEWVALATAPQ
ncbi:hypothetical protein [Rhizobium ruizarguesonis]|uniref:hypothetical protein n=1 Tax=Rhizobium ruizarguesonis TaxID=2081791 RepID=UPI001031113B|nr:hypothetical protein [Rhizobium ruizarguesonis]TBD80691.1 hypothetical protein ELH11_12690 [Rhizobium ruizarguesonis]TBE11852.1 hypothetical protein ELH09_12765 [Rhizobium ruizarguesonis]TBE23735.1 hypothetical protein ELH08_12995 [Rhizobium ruizarguesonis]TBE33576.1 hypothetical protein ELH07_13465 [Rhizobium ruizarguesonis]WSG99923.1 hypothetical protein U8P71_14955 [Rhizobium ruizarguesonis]